MQRRKGKLGKCSLLMSDGLHPSHFAVALIGLNTVMFKEFDSGNTDKLQEL